MICWKWKKTLRRLSIKKRLKYIDLLVLDFDGVITDNTVLLAENGIECVKCCRSDGLGIEMLRKLKIPIVILSSETNDVVIVRAQKLKVDCYHGVSEKVDMLSKIIRKYNCNINNVAYIGNDINDLTCMREVGIPVAVNNAYPAVKKVARLILKRNGGEGAVREFCERVVKAKKMSNIFWGYGK